MPKILWTWFIIPLFKILIAFIKCYIVSKKFQCPNFFTNNFNLHKEKFVYRYWECKQINHPWSKPLYNFQRSFFVLDVFEFSFREVSNRYIVDIFLSLLTPLKIEPLDARGASAIINVNSRKYLFLEKSYQMIHISYNRDRIM